MATYAETAAKTVLATAGRDRDRSVKSLVFLGLLWFSLLLRGAGAGGPHRVHGTRRRAAVRQRPDHPLQLDD